MTEEYTTKLKDEAKIIYAVLATGIIWGKESTVILKIDETATFVGPYQWIPFTDQVDFNDLYHPIGVGGVPKEFLERFLNFSDLGQKIALWMSVSEVRFETIHMVRCERTNIVTQRVIYDS